jgi:acid phosphatase (class A)
MRQKRVGALLTALFASVTIHAQIQQPNPAATKPIKPASQSGYFIDPTILDLTLILPPPPAQTSETTKSELVEIHRIENTRTPEQVAAAQADDKEEDIFVYKQIFGPDFSPSAFPLTAALSAHIRIDEGVVGKPLKTSFRRPRPFQYDATLHPVCELTKEPNSYPSGHTLSGYLLAFALAQMVPEKQEQILQRAENYSHNRLVCGVHYESDVAASRNIAYAVFGYMMANPRFQKELAAARIEMRQHLGLPLTTPHA